MNTYDSLDELWMDAVSDASSGLVIPSRDGGTTEVLGWSARLTDPTCAFLFNPERKLSPWYAAAELLWYLSGSNRIEMIQKYAAQYERFSDDGETAHGAYGKRMRGSPAFVSALMEMNMKGEGLLPTEAFFKDASYQSPLDQLQLAAMVLKDSPMSRQAVVSLWQDRDLVIGVNKASKDLPCTLTLQFLVREEKLNLIVNMRSNDVWLGLPYDVFCFCGIQRVMAEALNLELGFYQHHAGSLHLYDRNREKALSAMSPREFETGPIECGRPQVPVRKEIENAIQCEEHNRRIKTCTKPGFDHYSFIGQLVVWASLKWSQSGSDRVTSPLMKKHLKRISEC